MESWPFAAASGSLPSCFGTFPGWPQADRPYKIHQNPIDCGAQTPQDELDPKKSPPVDQ